MCVHVCFKYIKKVWSFDWNIYMYSIDTLILYLYHNDYTFKGISNKVINLKKMVLCNI